MTLLTIREYLILQVNHPEKSEIPKTTVELYLIIFRLCKHTRTVLKLSGVLHEDHAFLPCRNEDSGEQ